jgi:hypothetical protein
MARLIPSFFDEQTPPGEKDVFRLMLDMPADWVVIHSLDLAPWNRGLRTEIDFLVVAPNTGILCVEVKSHERIEFDGYMWQPPSIKKSPFKQAANGRYTFYRRIKELLPSFAQVPVVHLCIFPRARFDLAANVAVQPWELIDRRGLERADTAGKLAQLLQEMMANAIHADAALTPLLRPITPLQIEELVRHCVPVQKRSPSAREEIDRRREDIDRILRVQQAPVLTLATLNQRLVVTGPAGTGKTLIAMEVARRAAESGKRVALLCHNQLVGDWMADAVSRPALPNLVAGRAIRVMARLAGLTIPTSPPPGYWESDLPLLLEERLTDPDFRAEAEFDYLVIDEMQDLLGRPALWHAIGLFLEGGFSSGTYALFGDFENQSLSKGREAEKAFQDFLATVVPARWALSENCRNYRVIGQAAAALAGSGAGMYSGYLRGTGNNRDYEIEFYEDEAGQNASVLRALRDFKDRGFNAGEITLLSFRSDEHSTAMSLRRQGAANLQRPWPPTERTSFASVAAYKGMENRVIILTDLALSDASFERALFYTAMTRATESVRVFCHASSRTTLARWIAEMRA